MSLAELFKHTAEVGYAAIELWHRDESLEEIMAMAKESLGYSA